MKQNFLRLVIALSLIFPNWSWGQAIDISGIDHVAIRVTNLDVSAKWYEKCFGLRKIQEWKGVWLIGKANVRVGLFLVDKPLPADTSPTRILIDHFAFGVSAERFQGSIDQLRAAGIKLTDVEDVGIAYSVFMSDPDGHQIELFTYHGKGGTPPK